jgi:hypothetical protein
MSWECGLPSIQNIYRSFDACALYLGFKMIADTIYVLALSNTYLKYRQAFPVPEPQHLVLWTRNVEEHCLRPGRVVPRRSKIAAMTTMSVPSTSE